MSQAERPLKVLWVIPTIGSRFGGPTSTAVNGLIAENRAGFESELVSTIAAGESGDSVPAAGQLAENGVKVRLFPRTGLIERGEAWGLSPKLAWWLVRNVRRYDVVHLQYVWCMTSIVGALVARFSGVPLVITPHESLTDFDIDVASRHPLLRRMKKILRRLFLSTADQLILMSELEEQDTDYGPVPATIVSHAVLEERVPAPDPGPATAQGSLKIAFIGRNVEKKGIHLIIEAIGRQPERDWQLSIAGPPGTEEFVRDTRDRIESLGVADKVTWLGYVDDRQAFLRSHDVVAMPSVYEGFGMVSAEAMCVGVPVVVPKRSGVAELVAEFDAGVVMPESSADALEGAFLEFDDNPDRRRQLGLNGIEAANARLTFEAYADRTGEIYGTLVGS